jgi:hypothetical protein
MLDLDWGRLESDVVDGEFAPATTRSNTKYAKTQTFACEACFGTGKWRGGRSNNAGESKCFACGGKGHFMTSQADRDAAKQKRHHSKIVKARNDAAAFDESHPGVRDYLASAHTWSTFAADLLMRLNQYHSLSDRQIAAVHSMIAKSEARKIERERERAIGAAVVDLTPIRTMFESARGNGYQKPVYRAAGLVITRAPDTGRNPGALYVKSADSDDYLGKIIGCNYTGKPAPALAEIASDPRGAAIAYGQRTGRCSCCGRLLTNEGSINAGIGPICADKWGL